jgi:hypothetical protein
VGIEINLAKTNAAVRSVIVHRQVCEFFVAGSGDEAVYEFGAESSVTDLPLDVIRAFLCDVYLAYMQNQLAVAARHASKQHSSVLITVARKQVMDQDIEFVARNSDLAFVGHGILARKSRILRIFAVAF